MFGEKLSLLLLSLLSVEASGRSPFSEGRRWIARRPSSHVITHSSVTAMDLRGGSDEDEAVAAEKEPMKMYPALSEDEIASKLNTIPVFGLTDKSGNSAVLRTPDGENVNWCFLEHEVAEAMVSAFAQQSAQAETVDSDTSSKGGDLIVSDVPLGMIWKALTPPDALDKSKKVSDFGDTPINETTVQLRLLADGTDVEAAKNMTNVMLEQALNSSSSLGEGETAALIKRNFENKLEMLNREWGTVPVFTMANMKIRTPKKIADAVAGKNLGDDEFVEYRPWFLSVKDCIKSWKKASESSGLTEEENAVFPIQMATLEELVNAMRAESPADFRKMLFVPSESSIQYMREKVDAAKAALAAGSASGLGGEGISSDENLGEKSIFDDDDDDNDSDSSDIFK